MPLLYSSRSWQGHFPGRPPSLLSLLALQAASLLDNSSLCPLGHRITVPLLHVFEPVSQVSPSLLALAPAAAPRPPPPSLLRIPGHLRSQLHLEPLPLLPLPRFHTAGLCPHGGHQHCCQGLGTMVVPQPQAPLSAGLRCVALAASAAGAAGGGGLGSGDTGKCREERGWDDLPGVCQEMGTRRGISPLPPPVSSLPLLLLDPEDERRK